MSLISFLLLICQSLVEVCTLFVIDLFKALNMNLRHVCTMTKCCVDLGMYEQGAGGAKDDDEQSANAADLASTIDKPTFKSCQNNKRLLFHTAFTQSWLK